MFQRYVPVKLAFQEKGSLISWNELFQMKLKSSENENLLKQHLLCIRIEILLAIIFKRLNYRFYGIFFKKNISKTDILTQTVFNSEQISYSFSHIDFTYSTFIVSSSKDGYTVYRAILLHIIYSLFSNSRLFQNAIFRKMLKLVLWNYKPIFLQMQFLLVAKFFIKLLLFVSVDICILNMLHEISLFII